MLDKILDMFKGKDGNYSIRRVMAAITFYKLMNCDMCNNEYNMILAGLIFALLGLTTFQNFMNDKFNKQSSE